jgi:hypothetical protein
LQSDLIAFYKENCCTINICPGFDEVDASFKDVYIPPYPLYLKETNTLREVAKQSSEKKETTGGKPVNSLQEIFYKQSMECHNIYLTAEPGLGKTSFVKWLSLNWCHAHDPVKEDDHFFDQKEVNQLNKFDFVFVIFLREVNDQNINVDSMIRNTILNALGRQNKYTIDMIERVMCEERCLIVLDGLDEWNSACLPKRLIRPSCTYVTTSRPWKFCSIALNLKQIDQHVCIENVQTFCKEKLILSIMTMLEERKHLRKDISNIFNSYKEFIKVLEDKKISHFYGTPVILVQLVYLWNMKKSIGNSQFEIYSDMVDALFMRAEEKVDLSTFKNTRSSQIRYFQLSLCETYYDLMIRLGKLAFNTLFSGNKLLSLVFDKEVTTKYLTDENSNILACEILDSCLKTGLLSKQPVYVNSRRKKYTYSFQHKTVQEYFAALYIQKEYDTNVEVMIVKRCNTIEKILEMETVFMFLSGVRSSISDRVFQSLQGTINEDEEIQTYRRKTFWTLIYSNIKAIQDMKVKCTIECKNNGNEEFDLHLEDVIIDSSSTNDKYYDALKVLVQKNALNLKTLSLEHNGRAETLWNDFEIHKMSCLCCLNIGFTLFNRSTFSSGIVSHIFELNAEHIQSMHVSSYLPETDDLFEKFLLFVKKQTNLRYLMLEFRNNAYIPKLSLFVMNMNKYLKEASLVSIPLSQLQLNEHLQQLSLQNVPLSQLQLYEHLQQLTLQNVPLSQLQLNEHLQQLTLENVPLLQLHLNENLHDFNLRKGRLSQLKLNEHLQQLRIENVPLSQLQLNEHLKQLSIENVPLSQLQLNEHLQQLSIENVPLSQLQLNEHIQQLSIENVPLPQHQLNKQLKTLYLRNVLLSRLQLMEHSENLTLTNEPLSQLQLNEHLQELSLKNVPLSHLQLNEHLQKLTLENVPLSQLQLNENLHWLTLSDVPLLLQLNEHLLKLENEPLSQQQINENVEKKTFNISVSQENVDSINIAGILKFLEYCSMKCLPSTTVTAIRNCLPVKSNLKHLYCKIFKSAACISLCFTLPNLCHLQNIELSLVDLRENVLQLPCTGGLQLDLNGVTLTNKTLSKLLNTRYNHNVKVDFKSVHVEDDTLEYELPTEEQNGAITAEPCSSSCKTIKFNFEDVNISSKSFLQFIKLIEKSNSNVILKINLVDNTPYSLVDGCTGFTGWFPLFPFWYDKYREGIRYAKSVTSFIVKDDSFHSVEIVKKTLSMHMRLDLIIVKDYE